MPEFFKETKEGEYLKVKVVWQKFKAYLSLTYELNKNKNFSDRGFISGGCNLELIAKEFPKLKTLCKFHLCSTEGPMHYIANTLYFISNRDHNGLLKGETRQIKNGKTGLLCWHLVALDSDNNEIDLYTLNKSVDSNSQPVCTYNLTYRPWNRIGEGKEPDLNAARNFAIWPEAYFDDFTEEKLRARLPFLIQELKTESEKFLDWPIDE